MKNALCDQLGIEFPIFAFTHCRDVAAAVSRAGGLGVLGIAGLTPEQLEIELSWVDAAVDGAPYGVDVLIPATTAGIGVGRSVNDLLPEEHRRFVDDLLDRYDVPPLADRTSRLIPGVDPGHGSALVDQALGHSAVRLAASALGPPPPHLIEAAHRRDVMVASLVGAVHHAERQRDAGVDIVVAQGYEAGGHTGEITTMVLVPEVVDAVSPLPVLAAGGIARGRQLAAALALGAQGAWTGSVWLTTQEAETHPVVKEKFLAATSSSTVRSRSTTGKPARQLRTAWTEAWDDPNSPDPLPMPLQFSLIDEAHQRIQRSASARPGAAELITYFVGQVVGSLNDVKSARQVVFEMIEEYIEVAEQMGSSLHEN
jgi:NAD(P)H-dependent flavin oxidoreductase YrpB (nitropropane dioxygenase family)